MLSEFLTIKISKQKTNSLWGIQPQKRAAAFEFKHQSELDAFLAFQKERGNDRGYKPEIQCPLK